MALPLQPPLKPMLAKPAKAIPDSGGLLFEPKWDGFRCLVFRDGDEIYLQSRAEKPLNRYFPEAVERLLSVLPDQVVLDGELVVAKQGKLDFDALTERIHPAESRITLLAAEQPAEFVAFDVLALGDESFMDEPTSARRARLEKLAGDGISLTPATTDPATAREWFELIGKPMDEPYSPGKRVLLKYKHLRTADCVLAGLRWHVDGEPGELVGSFLLGLHDEAGVLHHVGTVGSFPVPKRRELAQELAPLITDGEDHPWGGKATGQAQRIPGGITRWRATEHEWVPLRPERVVEVAYENTEGGMPSRFRHNARFVRWRPDREPASCGYDQLDEPARYDLDAVFRGQVVRTR